MKVGLVRHFKVKKQLPKKILVSSKELKQWFKEYDIAEIEENEVNLSDVIWEKCFTSDLPRAIETANKIYSGDITQIKELREVQLNLPLKKDIKLPFLLWAILIKLGFLTPAEYIKNVRKQIESLLDEKLLTHNQDILIVSHGALMIYLRKELLKRGFRGPKFKTPENGQLYIFEK